MERCIKPAWLNLARDVAYGLEASEDPIPSGSNSGSTACSLSPSILPAWPQSTLSRQERETGTPDRRYPDGFAKLLNRPRTHRQDRFVPETSCLSFAHSPAKSSRPTTGSERALRPAVIQRKVTNGYSRHCGPPEYENPPSEAAS